MKKNEFVLANMIAAFVAAVIFTLAALKPGMLKNIMVYAVALIAYFAVAIPVYMRVKCRKNPELIAVIGGTGAWGLIYFLERTCFDSRANDLTRHKIPAVLYFAVVLATVFVVLKVLRAGKREIEQPIDEKKKLRRLYRLLIALVVVAINTSLLYINDVFVSKYILHHSHAYMTSLMNVYWGTPYNGLFRSIYGHYGILYYPIVKLGTLLGLNLEVSVVVAIMFVYCLLTVGCLALLNRYLKSNVMYTVSALSLLMLNGEWIYYQLAPHRMLFPVITLLTIAYCLKKNRRWIGWAVCCLSIVWNLDTGVICTGIWALANIYYDLNDGGTITLSRRGVITSILKNGILSALMCVGAYLFVGVYNIANGGKLNTLKEFIYPYTSSTYKIGYLETDFQTVLSGWWFVTIVFCCAVILYYLLRFLKERKGDERGIFELSACVMALGLLTYYINRTAWGNYRIVLVPVLLELAVATERLLKNRTQTAFLLLLAVATVSFELVGNFGQSFINRTKVQYDDSKFSAFCEEVGSQMPEGTVCFGPAALEVFARNDLDPRFYMEDWSDVSPANGNYAIDLVLDSDCEYFFTTCPLEDKDLSAFTLVNEWKYVDSEGEIYYTDFRLYQRNA